MKFSHLTFNMKSSLLALTGLLHSAFAAVAAAAVEARALEANQNFEVAASNYNFTEDFAPALVYTFNAITPIPDNVLAAGEGAGNKWFVENNYRSPNAELAADADAALEARDFWKVTKCVGSIMWAIGSTAIPVAKIARIKKYIEALGGVK